VGQLLQKGYMVNFDENKCLIMDKTEGHLIALVSMAPNKIFPLRMLIEEKVSLSSIMDDSSLWHQRYGHLNFNSLKVLKTRNMVIGLPTIDAKKNICEGCIMGKIHRLPSRKLHGGQKLLYNSSMQIFGAYLDILALEEKGTSYYLLMITLV